MLSYRERQETSRAPSDTLPTNGDEGKPVWCNGNGDDGEETRSRWNERRIRMESFFDAYRSKRVAEDGGTPAGDAQATASVATDDEPGGAATASLGSNMIADSSPDMVASLGWLGNPSVIVKESDILAWSPALLDALLAEHGTGGNIVWATHSHRERWDGYAREDQIRPDLGTGEHTGTIRPRVTKAKGEQAKRTKGKAEVFTPSWICNLQNNVVDRAWFGDGWADATSGSPFNEEVDDGRGWVPTDGDVTFADEPGDDPDLRSWQAYVRSNRMEMACGEAPYLVSRYDTTTGEPISVKRRIGLLDRKLRVVTENTQDDDEGWRRWALVALKSCYGFEYQGDSLLIARENMMLGWADAYRDRLGHAPNLEECMEVADIVAWNIFQMDGFTYCVPGTDEKSVIKNWDTGASYPFELQVRKGNR